MTRRVKAASSLRRAGMSDEFSSHNLKKESCRLWSHLPYLTLNPLGALLEVIRSPLLSCTFPVGTKVAITNPI